MFKRRLSFLIIPLFMIVLVNAFFTIQLEENSDKKSFWVNHTQQVLLFTNKYLSNVQDTETGQRGYLLSRDLKYLEPFQTGKVEAKANFDTLLNLTSDNIDQTNRLKIIQVLFDKKINELETTIQLTKENNFEEALALVKRNDGKILMDEIRKMINEIINEEKNLLVKRKSEYEIEKKWIVKLIIFEIIFFVFLTILYVLKLRHEIFKREEAQTKLTETTTLLQNVIGTSQDLIFVKDIQLRTILCNSAFAQALGKTPENLYGCTDIENGWLPEFVYGNPQKGIRGFEQDDNEVLTGQIVHNISDPIKIAEEIKFFDTIKLPLRDKKGSIIGVLGVSRDITERQLTEDKLKLFAKIFVETKEGILITDNNAIMVDVNPAFIEISGFDREDVIGQNPSILSSGKQNATLYKEMWQSINTRGYWQGEIWNRKKTGELYAELLSISSLTDDSDNVLHYVGIFSDVTNSKNQQVELERMAHYDALTQLPNRVLLNDRFSQALSHCKRQENLLAVCFLDLDNFKPVNDLHGHEAGDQLLIDVAQRIKAIIRDEDTISRQGGDEFVLLLRDIESFSHCEKMLKRIIYSLAEPYIINRQSITISASIGITLYPLDNSDSDTLMRHADQAMYQAKTAGRNRYQLFNTEQDQIETQKFIQLEEIQHALENNELRLYYQPKVNMVTGNVFGAEALIRWIHPKKGLVPPLKFLPAIEGTQLEIEIGNWVIKQALKQLNEWQQQDIKLEVSVNISSFHLQHASFVTDLESALTLYPEVSSKKLQLEVLESSALGDLNTITGIINTCINALGVSIALDDFGTGYSSLTHLRNLPVQTIKIDQTFVRDMLGDPSDYTIIDGVIGLAESFDREIIAEGVETTEHGLMLLTMGCKIAQGYGIAKPMPSQELPIWLTDYIPNKKWKIYANKAHTEKEHAIKLFRLTITQWQKDFETNINSSPDNTGRRPILKRTKCHCGIWIKRAKQGKLFEEEWIEKLETAHDVMHDAADNLFNKYQQGEIDSARDNLNIFQTAAENMLNVFGQCE